MMTDGRRDTTFTKGAILGLVGSLLLVFYLVPTILLAVGLAVLLAGLGMIALSVLRFRRRLLGSGIGGQES